MLVPFRTTANGTEYWDKVNKKCVFYPNGTMPTEYVDQTDEMIGQYSASGKIAKPVETTTHVNEVIVTAEDAEALTDEANELLDDMSDDKELDSIDLSDDENEDLDLMDIDELRDYANEKGIAIPGNMKKAETIRAHIVVELNG